YVAANHWPRAWYERALANPKVQVTWDGQKIDYQAVPVTGAEHDRVEADNPHSAWFRFATGYPPRRFLRLDPAGPPSGNPSCTSAHRAPDRARGTGGKRSGEVLEGAGDRLAATRVVHLEVRCVYPLFVQSDFARVSDNPACPKKVGRSPVEIQTPIRLRRQ